MKHASTIVQYAAAVRTARPAVVGRRRVVILLVLLVAVWCMVFVGFEAWEAIEAAPGAGWAHRWLEWVSPWVEKLSR